MSKEVLIARSGDYAKDDPNCFNRLHHKLPMVAEAGAGDTIVYETRDAFDDQFVMGSTGDDVANVDLGRVHPMTGPVHVYGAERGDVLAVTVVDIAPADYGYTLIAPGFGFLRDVITGPFIANWSLDRLHATSKEMPGISVPMCAFPGSIGVLPGEPEVEAALKREGALAEAGGFALMPDPTSAVPESLFGAGAPFEKQGLRTVPPRENGGNMDVKAMQVGTTILFPVFVDGAGLWMGDIHYAQGDGEVCGTAIEMGARVTVRCEVRKGAGRHMAYPNIEGGGQLMRAEPARFYATTGLPLKAAGELPPHLAWTDSPKLAALENVAEDLTLATRDALLKMIDWLQREKSLSAEQAYVLCAAAVDLRIGQLVDVPNFMVSAVLPLDVFEQLQANPTLSREEKQ